MAVHFTKINHILAGLECSPLPHFLVQDGRVVGSTSSCLQLLQCDQEGEIRDPLIQDWIVY